MYKLSVGSLFKNEAYSIKEWLEHYINQGVEHFYLINDDSNDNYLEILTPFIDKGIVSLFDGNNWGRYIGRQRDMFNKFILPRLKESAWLIILDLDEYLWSPHYSTLVELLDQCKRLGQIQVMNTIFGSNGHITQPKSIVAGFTKRAKIHPTDTPENGNVKYIVNSAYEFSSLNVHYATFTDKKYETGHFECFSEPWLVLNHYKCQSKQVWDNVKCTRGAGDNYHTKKPEHFPIYDLNEVEDTRLYERNKHIIEKLI